MTLRTTSSNATLHMLCGKIAAGKSTLSANLGEAERTIVISEDRWIGQLYPRELRTFADYFPALRQAALDACAAYRRSAAR
jgi:predicted kinase